MNLEGCAVTLTKNPPVFGGVVIGYCSVNVPMPTVSRDEISIGDIEASVSLGPIGRKRPVKPICMYRTD